MAVTPVPPLLRSLEVGLDIGPEIASTFDTACAPHRSHRIVSRPVDFRQVSRWSSLRSVLKFWAKAVGTLLPLTLGLPAGASEGPSLTSARNNVAYAVGSLCAPYVLDHVDTASLPIGKGLVQRDGHDALARPNPSGVRVGFAGFVHVTFAETADGVRTCDVGAKGADPQDLRKAALDVLSGRPEKFAPTQSKYLPGRFATEDIQCASGDSATPGAFFMLSSPRPEERDRIALLLTL